MDETHPPRAVVLDLGKHKSKRVKDLRKGRGRLLGDIERAVDELRAQGVLGADAQTVVVVVERKAAKLPFPFPRL
jgi:hypothetical protein